MPKWLLSDLLSMLSSPPFEPLDLADWDHVLVKTVILILLATGRRMVEIAAMIPDCSPVEKNLSNSSGSLRLLQKPNAGVMVGCLLRLRLSLFQQKIQFFVLLDVLEFTLLDVPKKCCKRILVDVCGQ